MSSTYEICYFYVMDSNETSSWHQPITHLRQWQRRRVIEKVTFEAESRGFDRFMIFDAQEDLQLEGRVNEPKEP